MCSASSRSFTTWVDQAFSTVLLAGAPEDLLGETGQLQRNAELAAVGMGKAEILARQVQGESNVVAAVQDQLAFSLVYEARAGACLDCRKRLREVETASLREHQRLARGDQVDKSQHVGDHFDDTGLAQLPHVEDRAAHGLERRQVLVIDRAIAPDQDRNFACDSAMHTTGDGRLQGCDSARGGHSADTLDLVLVRGAHLDPGAASAQSVENAVVCGEHRCRSGWRRKAGDDGVNGCSEILG